MQRSGKMNNCNQCQKMMKKFAFEHIGLDHAHLIYVCNRSECPNFGLMQISADKIKKLEEEEVNVKVSDI